MRYSRLLPILGVLFLLPGLARAQQTDDELAKQYYKLGEELYNRADYEGALKQFQQAYKLSNKPALLYNMARCNESLGQHEKAIELLREYLKSSPENANMIEARIANLQRLVEKKQQKPPQPPPASNTVTPPPVTPEPTEPRPTPPRPSHPLRWPGWIGVGAGGVLLITGIALGALAKSKASDLEKANSTHQEYSAFKGMEDTQRTYRNASIGTVVAGGVLAVTGAVLLILDSRSTPKERRVQITPTVGLEGAGLAGEIRF
jgi:tetratricopeptide (TPR) repeat protein